MQILNLLFIGTSYFPLEQADWEEQLTKVFFLVCVRGEHNPFGLQHAVESKSTSVPLGWWMRASPNPTSCSETKFAVSLCHGMAWPWPWDRTQPGMALSSCVPAEGTRPGISVRTGEPAKTFTSCWQEWFEQWIYPRGCWINLQMGWRKKARCDWWQNTENPSADAVSDLKKTTQVPDCVRDRVEKITWGYYFSFQGICCPLY